MTQEKANLQWDKRKWFSLLCGERILKNKTRVNQAKEYSLKEILEVEQRKRNHAPEDQKKGRKGGR